MTLTEIALMSPRLARLSRISCCAAGSPDGGLRKTISTPTSPAALLQPFSTIDQKGSGLLLTKATFGFVPVEMPPAPDGFGALQAARGIVSASVRERCRRDIVAPGSGPSIGRYYRTAPRKKPPA